jgi:hypothetical protein
MSLVSSNPKLAPIMVLESLCFAGLLWFNVLCADDNLWVSKGELLAVIAQHAYVQELPTELVSVQALPDDEPIITYQYQ